jgi:hypothetical protein
VLKHHAMRKLADRGDVYACAELDHNRATNALEPVLAMHGLHISPAGDPIPIVKHEDVRTRRPATVWADGEGTVARSSVCRPLDRFSQRPTAPASRASGIVGGGSIHGTHCSGQVISDTTISSFSAILRS